MIATTPDLSPEDIRLILRELAAQGKDIPEPQSVSVEEGEDHEGDSVYFLNVTFGRAHKPENIPWMTISPLIHSLSRKIFLDGGGKTPVIPKVRRLAEKN